MMLAVDQITIFATCANALEEKVLSPVRTRATDCSQVTAAATAEAPSATVDTSRTSEIGWATTGNAASEPGSHLERIQTKTKRIDAATNRLAFSRWREASVLRTTIRRATRPATAQKTVPPARTANEQSAQAPAFAQISVVPQEESDSKMKFQTACMALDPS